jgi:predicted MPP superfamily phosphohydrolase
MNPGNSIMRRRDFLKLFGVLAGASVGGVAYAKQSNIVAITKRDLFVPSITSDLKIVAISDLHAPSYFQYNDYQDLANIINGQDPDILILAGDMIEEAGAEELATEFSLLKAKITKLAILGNWEYYALLDLERLRKEYEKAGVTLLVNERIELKGLIVAGLDDFLHGSPDYRLLNEESTNPLLVISHCPESFDFMPLVHKSPLIIISGHTHGGQIAPFGVVLVKPDGCGPYEKGWYWRGKQGMYVMRGVGTTGIPVRIGSRPEVLVLNLWGTESTH